MHRVAIHCITAAHSMKHAVPQGRKTKAGKSGEKGNWVNLFIYAFDRTSRLSDDNKIKSAI